MDVIKVKIERIVFKKDDFVIGTAPYEGKIVSIKGIIPNVIVGSEYEISGGWSADKYGEYFKVESSVICEPTTISAIECYLSSGLIHGIGPKAAKDIVKHFGIDTLNILDKHPERLTEVYGIGKKKAKAISTNYAEQRSAQAIMLFLKAQGISNSAAIKIYRRYGDDAITKIKDNPYSLAEDVIGIGFKKADAIALSLGYQLDGIERLKSGILFALDGTAQEGHSCYPRPELVKKASASDILNISPLLVDRALDNMIDMGELIIEQGDVFKPSFYYAENFVAGTFASKSVKITPNKSISVDEVEKNCDLSFAPNQRKAIEEAITHKMFILTGGPGTGKTTTTLGIIQALEMLDEDICLAAPTGRAAKRLSEVTGHMASTIHRLLGFVPEKGFQMNEDNPLSCSVLIIDESSMVDLSLMYHVCKALKDDTKLILVGDSDQLPSVGAGNVLKDAIGSQKVPCVVLNEIFRQAQDSQIVMNAHDVNSGIVPSRTGKDFFIAVRPEKEAIQAEILRLVSDALPKNGYKKEDIQVLSPMRRAGDPIAATELNRLLQEVLNPNKEGIRKGNTIFRIDDRVMQMKNNYNLNVFNGDTGVVRSVDIEGDTMDVFINDELVTYSRAEFEELELAYASTIHKSQGSEYPVVIVPLHESQFIMLERNLLYTAITRAKKMCMLIGTPKAISMATARHSAAKRCSHLVTKIKGEKA